MKTSCQGVKMSQSVHSFYHAETLLFLPIKIGAYVLAAVTILTNIFFISVWSYFLHDNNHSLSHFYKQPVQNPHPVLFSFYQWKSDDQLAWDIQTWVSVFHIHFISNLFRWGPPDIIVNLLSIVLIIVGLIGVQKKNPFLARFLTVSVVGRIFWWICDVLLLHIYADGFTVSDAAAFFITTLVVLILAFVGLYFAYCLESLCFKLQQERKEEEPGEVAFYHYCIFHL